MTAKQKNAAIAAKLIILIGKVENEMFNFIPDFEKDQLKEFTDSISDSLTDAKGMAAALLSTFDTSDILTEEAATAGV